MKLEQDYELHRQKSHGSLHNRKSLYFTWPAKE